MRIIEQIQTTILGLTDQFVIDGSSGTRAIKFEDLLKAINEKISWMALWGDNIPVEARRNIWRGKNLGSQVTQTQWNEIDAGTFRNMFTGDYWEIGGRIWRIVDMNYWLNTGDTPCTTPHLVIMPDSGLFTAKMNDTNTTTGGYVGSKMYQESMTNAITIVNGAFGEAHILTHRELLINTVTNGRPSGGSYYDSNVILPNEPMMYGSYIFAPANDGTNIPYRYTIDKTQLAAMRLNPNLINPLRQAQWLRDVVSAACFADVTYNGFAHYNNASGVIWTRPVFGIKADED